VHHGTLLVDLERHRPIDLLPNRTANALAPWLRAHPGVNLLICDYQTECVRGATLSAPNVRGYAVCLSRSRAGNPIVRP
jgi:transposase